MNIKYIGNNNLFNESYSINNCIQEFKNEPILSLDIETTGLCPYRTNVVMFQIGTLNTQYIIDVRGRENNVKELVSALQEKLFVGANLKFEYKFIKHHFGIELGNLYDVLLADQIINRGLKKKKKLKKREISVFSLSYLAQYYLGIKMDKSSQTEFINIGSNPFTQKQIEYGALDIIVPLKLKDKLDTLLSYKGLKNYFNLEMKYLCVLGDIELNGMHFNKDKWLSLYKKRCVEQKGIKQKLDSFILSNFKDNPKYIDTQYSLFSEGLQCKINWNSSKQVIPILKEFKACPKAKSNTTGNIEYTVDAKVLQSSFNTINKDKPEYVKDFIKLYLEYKEYSKLTGTYGIEFTKNINPVTGRIHTDYWQIQTTGRISSSKPNLQQIPSNEEYRECFGCPEGSKVINADYGGQETVILANKSGESNMIKLIKNGGDMHSFVAKRLQPDLLETLTDKQVKENYPEIRQEAKSAGFAIQFGGDGNTIASNLGVSKERGDKVYNAYFKAFPTLKQYFDKVSKEALKKGYILTDKVSGAKTFFKKPRSNYERHEIYKKALNYPIQGEAAVMTKYANILLKKKLKQHKLYDTHIIITANIHDEIQLESKEEVSKIAANILEQAMKESADLWCKNPKLKADAVISNYWTH